MHILKRPSALSEREATIYVFKPGECSREGLGGFGGLISPLSCTMC